MGKKAKERKQTQVSPDYISASAGNSGILRDMAGHFAGTGRYVVPTITAACAMQGTVMPVCQVQAAAVVPADSVTIGAGDSMTVPAGGESAVSGVTVSSSGKILVSSGGNVYDTNVSSFGYMEVTDGLATSTFVTGGRLHVYSGGVVDKTEVEDADSSIDGTMQVFSGGLATGTLINGGNVSVNHGGVVNSTILKNKGVMWIAGEAYIIEANSNSQIYCVYGKLTSVTINSGSELMMSQGSLATSTIINSGGSIIVLNQGSATNTVINNGGIFKLGSGGKANSTTLNSGSFNVSGGSATGTLVSGGSIKVWLGGVINSTTLNKGNIYVMESGRAISTTLNEGTMDAGGSDSLVSLTTVNSNGKLNLKTYGVAISTTISSGGGMNVSKGSATSTSVCGGSLTVSSGGLATITTVDNGGAMTLEGGTASKTTVNSGTMAVTSGGSADITTVNSSGSMTLTSGTATNTTVNGGSLNVSAGGLASDNIIDLDGTMMVVGGSASNTTVNNGTLTVSSGGTASNTILNSGTMAVTSNGSADITTVKSGGSMTLTDSSATNTTVDGGSLTVSSGGLAMSTTVDNGGAMTLAEGTASNTTVNSGTLAVTSGGSADITTVNSNGSMTLTSGTATSTTVNGGSLTVSAGGMASDNIIDLDGTMMVVGGSASNTIVNSGGSLAVSAGGLATSTTVDSGGFMNVSSGGVASSTAIINGGSVTVNGGSVADTAISSGIMEVISSGLATNTTVYNGGSLSVTGNSTVNNIVLSGGTFTNPTAGTNAFISGTVSGDGNITGPGDFTIANGNILLNSGSVSTTGKLTIDKVLDTTKPAVSATTINVGGVDVTNLDKDTSTGGTLLAADTGLAGVNMISGTTNAVLSSNGQNVTFDGAAYTDTSIPGFTLDYKDPPVTYSLVNSVKEVEYSITGNKQATKLTFGSIGWLDSGAFINHTNQFADIVFSGADVDTSKIHFNNVDSLQANKTMTLVSDFGNTVGKITGTKYTVGTTLQGNGKAQLVGNDLVYKVETDSVTMSPKTVAQEQTHNTLMGMEAGLAVINSGQEFIEKAVDGFGDINNIGNDGIAVYAGMGVSKDRYETGSHINLNTWNGIIGVGKANELPDGKIQWGGFLEHGSGNFSIHSDINSRGDGSSTYTGGGVVAKWTNKHDVYTEAGLRYGRSHDNASNVLQDALGKTYGYDVCADYYGGYLGVGKIYRLGKDRTLDVYGKFFSTHRDGVSFDAGGRYELDALQSNILRVGAKYGVKSGKVNWYGGLAYEHEFSGEATGKADGLPIRSASIKGGSLRLDLGATIKPSEKSPWTMRMGITGHTGKHRGIGGNFMLSYNF